MAELFLHPCGIPTSLSPIYDENLASFPQVVEGAVLLVLRNQIQTGFLLDQEQCTCKENHAYTEDVEESGAGAAGGGKGNGIQWSIDDNTVSRAFGVFFRTICTVSITS